MVGRCSLGVVFLSHSLSLLIVVRRWGRLRLSGWPPVAAAASAAAAPASSDRRTATADIGYGAAAVVLVEILTIVLLPLLLLFLFEIVLGVPLFASFL